MATTEEIERRVGLADAARSERRTEAARTVGELAARHADIAAQLGDIERELKEVLAESSSVIGLDELAAFTDVPAADLARWANDPKGNRTKRKKPAAAGPSAAKSVRGVAVPAEVSR
ncbi:hypothetical protein [Amycolatopsis sp. cmx-11-32]|uniref:hypothetical protein n=1 Tax=Amycolatopsis sp. cmx-11-32 TaxID=2785796 RepID=UPI0039E5BC70